ncbi:MFS transporter [Erwinia sp. ErVv1]|uniref:MFS transporter n=1 Tax=Erwinia sp. ErVv1 TaxID=1603299 RepID=UPI000836A9A4|nr:MFS transporter [Erwinia sp. ErVv1]
MSEPQLLKPLPDWTDDEKPSMPGSPSTPSHSFPIRIAYGLVALLIGLTGGLGTALVSANLPAIQGSLGLTPVEGSWLTAAYLMVNVSANLLVFKFRQQYGMRLFAEIGLTLYAVFTLLHLFVDSFAMGVMVRAASGFAGASVSSLAIFYMLQAVGKARMVNGLILGLGISQLATPLAWILSPALSDVGQWHVLYQFEAGLAVCSLAAVVSLKLPPGILIKTFEKTDFITFLLIGSGLALFCAVLIQGVNQWWFNARWIGLALAAGWVLILGGGVIEHYRRAPLIQTRWLLSVSTLRFAFGAFTMRFLLSEQTYGAVGMLRSFGMVQDQLQILYAAILAGLLVGIIGSAVLFNPKTMVLQILLAVVLIIIGSSLDHLSTNLTRPVNMLFSQFLIAMASGIFLGPMMLMGVMSALKNGPAWIVSFAVLFSVSQNFGGLAGPALLGTMKVYRQQAYTTQLNEDLQSTRPQVTERTTLYSNSYAGTLTDPQLRNAQGSAQLSQVVSQEASIRAFNDIFVLTGTMAMGFLGWSLFHVLRLARQKKNASTPSRHEPDKEKN